MPTATSSSVAGWDLFIESLRTLTTFRDLSGNNHAHIWDGSQALIR